jgi:hypothetical protein
MCRVKGRRKTERLEKRALDLFRRWGRAGARKRTRLLTPEERREIAKNAARARWAKVKKKGR